MAKNWRICRKIDPEVVFVEETKGQDSFADMLKKLAEAGAGITADTPEAKAERARIAAASGHDKHKKKGVL